MHFGFWSERTSERVVLSKSGTLFGPIMEQKESNLAC